MTSRLLTWGEGTTVREKIRSDLDKVDLVPVSNISVSLRSTLRGLSGNQDFDFL